MSIITLNISYPGLSSAIINEFNKRDVEVKSFKLQLTQFEIKKNKDLVILEGKISSSWNASFKITLDPFFDNSTGILTPNIKRIQFKSNNLIFKGALQFIKPVIKNQVHKMSALPLIRYGPMITAIIDKEISKTTLPYHMMVTTSTTLMSINEIQFHKDSMHFSCEINQDINISSKDVSDDNDGQP